MKKVIDSFFASNWLRIKIFLSILRSRFINEMDLEMQLSMAGIHADFAQEKKPLHRAVGISRKDTIIIAMLVNIALLAVLFATASRQTHSAPLAKVEPVVARFETVSQVALAPAQPQPKAKEPIDEIDELLKSYALKTAKPAVVEVKSAPEVAVKADVPRIEPLVVAANTPKTHFVEVKVKKGDVLSRIARLHNVKVEDLIVLNGLESAHLKIGQTLKIPTTKVPATSQKQVNDLVAEYYIVKEGDSPWKIAKKCRISVDDLLRLNNLDETKARNLKIGQKLRIR